MVDHEINVGEFEQARQPLLADDDRRLEVRTPGPAPDGAEAELGDVDDDGPLPHVSWEPPQPLESYDRWAN